MTFTGKPTISDNIQPNAESLSDIIGALSPYRTELLHHLGDPKISSGHTSHTWADDDNPPPYAKYNRYYNDTQIFTAKVEAPNTLPLQYVAVEDEIDNQKRALITKLMMDLENCVINGVRGSSSTCRAMNGIIKHLTTNLFGKIAKYKPGTLTEKCLNDAIHDINCDRRSTDTIVVSKHQWLHIVKFAGHTRKYYQGVRHAAHIYNSEYGPHRIILSEWVPADTVLLLSSHRISVLPAKGRSFQFNRETMEIVGEYTLEIRDEDAHGLIGGLDVLNFNVPDDFDTMFAKEIQEMFEGE